MKDWLPDFAARRLDPTERYGLRVTLAVIALLMLALPFAYLQSRAGGMGLKLFLGVMLGVGFYFMNGLFSNLGVLNTWPPWLAVSIPSLVAFALALAMLGRVGRSY